ncbi:MAG: NAD-dependent epimerase/dehydratase family protein [Lachnospiraceae bacterium]|nr:NAD-dependent epimerase/dehydratase family protein [Lachnospiraceae bacterium]
MSKKRILITGFSGFVSRHFLAYLQENEHETEVCGVDINPPAFDYSSYRNMNVEYHTVDLLETGAVRTLLDQFRPDYIIHLASFSSVAYSWKHPIECFQNNTNIFLNIIAVVQELHLKCRVLSVGSSEEYGNVTKTDLPLREDSSILPCSPYAVARVAQEMLSRVYADSYGVDIVMTRSFNHIGPWQDTRFVIPGFISRILDIKKSGRQHGTIETGDLSIIRDFVDVRDVVRAYYDLLLHGKSGELYNVCSGKGCRLSDIVDRIAGMLEVKIDTAVNPEFVRLNDNRIIIGSYEKISRDIGWKPTISMDTTLRDMIDYYELKGDCYAKKR